MDPFLYTYTIISTAFATAMLLLLYSSLHLRRMFYLLELKSLIPKSSSSSSLNVTCSRGGRFNLWNISSRDSEDEESRRTIVVFWACFKGRNFFDPIFALKLWKPVFIVCHVEDNPDDWAPVSQAVESELPEFNNETFAEDVVFSADLKLDVCLFSSLMAAYLLLINSLFPLYWWLELLSPSSFNRDPLGSASMSSWKHIESKEAGEQVDPSMCVKTDLDPAVPAEGALFYVCLLYTSDAADE